MSNTKEISVINEAGQSKSISTVIQGLEVNLPGEGVIDVEKEVKRLEKDLDKLNKDLSKTSGKLTSSNFLEKAPPEVINKEKSKQQEFEYQINKISEILEKLKSV